MTENRDSMVDVREAAEKAYRFETSIAGMFCTPVVYLIDSARRSIRLGARAGTSPPSDIGHIHRPAPCG